MAKIDKDLSTRDIAKLLEVSERTVAKWIDSGFLRGYRHPGPRQHRRVQRKYLIKFVKENGLADHFLKRVTAVDGSTGF